MSMHIDPVLWYIFSFISTCSPYHGLDGICKDGGMLLKSAVLNYCIDIFLNYGKNIGL